MVLEQSTYNPELNKMVQHAPDFVLWKDFITDSWSASVIPRVNIHTPQIDFSFLVVSLMYSSYLSVWVSSLTRPRGLGSFILVGNGVLEKKRYFRDIKGLRLYIRVCFKKNSICTNLL